MEIEPTTKTPSEIQARMENIVARRPLDINIETNNFCPAKCVFCPNSKITRKKEMMSMDLFKKVCEDYYSIGGGAVAISSNFSDVFSDGLLADRFKILAEYKDKFYIYIVTNLISLAKYKDETVKEIVPLLDEIWLSIGMGGGGGDKQRWL